MTKDEAYRPAEKKNAEALRAGATKLGLSAFGNSDPLTELPESLVWLAQLRTLKPTGNST